MSAKRPGQGLGALPPRPGMVATYKPSGPKCADYIISDAPITVIIGPEGSGKTIGSGAKMLWAAQQQAPSPHDGVVRVKGYIIRSTYRDLWDKTIPSYRAFWGQQDPKEWSWVGGKGEPATHIIRMLIPDPTAPDGLRKYELIHEFRAFGDHNIDDFVAGLETTWIYLNEVNTLPANVLSKMYRRCGRYPAPEDRPDDGRVRWFGVFGDMNPEDESHWTFTACMTDAKKDGVRVIQQPSGFSPEAENIHSLRKIHPDYYRHRAAQMEDWEVKRMIEGRWGFSRSGQPIYADDWDDDVHAAKDDIKPNPRWPLYALVDAGGRPAMVLAQQTDAGGLVLIDELTTADNDFADVETFSKRCLARVREFCPGMQVKNFIPDPSAKARTISSNHALAEEDRHWIGAFWLLTGWPPMIPHTNDLDPRVRAVRRRLRLGKRGLLVSPRCKMVRAGFNSGYKLRKADPLDGKQSLADLVVKNRYSHPHDAVQYGALVLPLPAEIMTAEDLANGSPPLAGSPMGEHHALLHDHDQVIRD
jgi:hypothetical protein